jgi:hypothetical protein
MTGAPQVWPINRFPPEICSKKFLEMGFIDSAARKIVRAGAQRASYVSQRSRAI